MKYFVILLFLVVSLFAKTYDKLSFKGEGIDFLVGDFASSNLYKVIGKEYPPFYTPWRSNPTFSDNEFQEYKIRLKDYCESLGYFRSDINITAGGDAIDVVLNLNDPIRVKTIKVHPDEKFKNAILFKENSPFNTANFSQSKKRIERYMLENGHPKYGFDAKAYVDLDKYEVNLDFFVDKNGTYQFADTTISGNEDVDEEIIREAFEHKNAKLYDIREIEKSYDNLYELGVYDFINFSSEFDKNSTKVPIKLDLVMGETKFLKASAGYSTNEGARGSISWIDKNFLGNLKVFDIGLKVTEVGYEAYNIFYNPRIIVPVIGKITFENDVNYKKYRYDTFDETTLLNRITFGKRAYGLEHYFGLLTEYSKIDAKVEDAENESGNYFINSLFYKLLIDKRDSKINAKNGYYISLYLEKSMKGIGSDLDYLKSTADLRYIKTYGNKLTFATKLRVGRIDANVPIFKRFFTGGANTNRGYDYRELGPKDSANIPLGGVSLVDAMFEMRYRVWQKLWITSFYDTSLLSLKPDDFNDKYYGSYGCGMRYNTVIGPIRIDFGFPQDEDDWKFHISIGQVF